MNFNKTFFITPEETQRQIEHFHKTLTWDKSCSVCVNSEKRPNKEMGYAIETTWCKVSGKYVDYKCGNACKNWKAKYPQYEKR